MERAPHVDFVIGPGNVGYLDHVLEGERRVALDFPHDRVYDYLSVDRPSATLAQITVMEGCNKNCTFCIVPTTRGREVSRPMSEILSEVRHALETGRVDIELLGQTVNAYRCPVTGAGFGDLLESVAGLQGVKRLRFMTSHPAEVAPRMIEVMRDRPNISRFLHLPVQSGSSAILRRMKRLYTRERYLEIIAAIRREIPAILFSTDIIVGFPGETDEDFEQTLSLVREVRFGSLFAFKYSPRPGTPALRIGAPVDDALASDRLARLFAVQEEIQKETLRDYEGTTVPVIFEGVSRHDDAVLSGKSDHNWTVNFRSDRPLRLGDIVPVRITSAQHHTLRGEAVL
jgi:tRNA-2-methylthio-N6-dimethylallyladenosine synthase